MVLGDRQPDVALLELVDAVADVDDADVVVGMLVWKILSCVTPVVALAADDDFDDVVVFFDVRACSASSAEAARPTACNIIQLLLAPRSAANSLQGIQQAACQRK
jgi:hypothetical protein